MSPAQYLPPALSHPAHVRPSKIFPFIQRFALCNRIFAGRERIRHSAGGFDRPEAKYHRADP